MTIYRKALLLLLGCTMLLLGGCANLPGRDPVQVIVAGVEPLPGEGLELRMLVKLRIQNPNDAPLDFNGMSVQLDVQGKPFATGVSDAAGSVPRFGETVVNIPVSASVFRIVRQAIGTVTGDSGGKLSYVLSGKLAGPAFSSMPFQSSGVLTLPAQILDKTR